MSATGETSCIFCRIAKGEIPAEFLHDSDEIIAFRDIRPQAPSHAVLIPREHITSLAELAGAEAGLFQAAAAVAAKLQIVESGFRVVLNQGADAGQEVAHIHFHLLGGRKLGWPPG
jgi:histidine triad (HIT) family protein